MKKIYLTLSLLFMAGLTQAASLQYIPSTSTFFNYKFNVASGTLKNFTVQTATAGWVHASSGSIDSLTISSVTAPFIIISSGSASFSNLTATGAVIGTMSVTGMTVTESTFTRQIVGISTVTNGMIQNANIGQLFSTGTWTYSGGVINGTKTDNSTTTFTAKNQFLNGIQVSTTIVLPAIFSVQGASVAIAAPAYIAGTNTNDNAPPGYYGEYGSTIIANVAVSAGSSGQFKNVCSTTLAAGDWDLQASLQSILNGATETGVELAISVNSGNTTSDHVPGSNDFTFGPDLSTQPNTRTMPRYRLSLATPTTVFFKAAYTFSLGTPQWTAGNLSARRAR